MSRCIQRVVDDRYPSFAARTSFLKRIPEKKDLGNNKWLVAGTDFTVLIIYHAWPKEKVIFGQDAKVLFDLIFMRFISQNKSANLIARFKVENYCPDMPDDYIDHPIRPLSLYQKVGFMASLNQDAYAYFWDAGVGKTPPAIARINYEGHKKRISEGKMYLSLIVCPNQVRINWGKEFERFSVHPGKISTLRGGQLERVKHLTDGIMEEADCDWSACIVSIDSVPFMWDTIKLVPWDLIVYDESHFTKNSKTRRFKFLKKYAQFPHIKQRMNLTGTPIANSPMDLWAQLELLGEGLSGFMSFENFKECYGKYKDMTKAGGTPVQKLIGLRNMPLLQERLSRICFLMTKKEANINLPDVLYDFAEVDMTTKQAKIYKDVASKLVYEIENDLSNDSKRITAEHILTKLLRLAQITAGYVTWDKIVDLETFTTTGGNVEQISEINPKVEYIISEVTDPNRDPNGKMMLWSCFIEDLRILSAKLSELNINHVGYHRCINEKYRVKDAPTAEHVINFDDSCKVFIGNPASSGIGQNFLGYDKDHPNNSKMYVDRQIFMTCNWSSLHRIQAEARAARRDARAPSIRITDLVIPGTIDMEIRDRLQNKKQMAMEIQDLRDILKRLL